MGDLKVGQPGYTLVICEKPDAARRVADALADGMATSSTVDGSTVFRFRRDEEEYVVCSAQGHVYSVSDPFQERWVYPVFDLEWYPSDLVAESARGSSVRISAIRKLAQGASKFVNACDFDVEGETIGFNLLRYACGGKEKEALRAKFSTLTKYELVEAFRAAAPKAGDGSARAGRARHLIDFVWGVNLSRVLSQSALDSGGRYRTISMGRVQGPALGFLVQREVEIRQFVPLPFWKVSATLSKEGVRFLAAYSKDRIDVEAEADGVRIDCLGKEAVVGRVERRMVQVGPPTPFNVGDLQKEAYRAFGYSPSRTLQVAERLYLGALMSYPRTGSQKLPQSINYRRIIQGLGGMREYSIEAGELLRGDLKPVQGAADDAAHPAIYPTGEKPRRQMDPSERSVFELVVRRFLAAFGQSARREAVDVEILAGQHAFVLKGARTVFPGWTHYYGKYSWFKEAEVPRISEGDRLLVADVRVEEKFEQRPPRYTQAGLLERMEKERIGTKATRADIIATLVARGYAAGERLEVTDLGFAVFETMQKYSPSIVTTDLTRAIEGELEAVEGGRAEAGLVRDTARSMAIQAVGLMENQGRVGSGIGSAAAAALAQASVLGPCPVCKNGQLRIITSRRTKKRFVGCSNYASGCRASAPLPQRGKIKTTTGPCEHCGWPVVYVLGGRVPWKLCVNINCPSKAGRSNEVRPV